MHDRLLTNGERFRQHLVDIENCPLCHDRNDSTIYVLRDCGMALKLWSKLVPHDSLELLLLHGFEGMAIL
ncbi:conserved hypothetical protein [Ricinus communis]|uniref:Reverse transcriptase zinc-binding domain-containing protein n=1 Tax=Ricinus communis TaxID=3988 RepID=B9SZG1_RICCO|nr:conserved hypothetical protein [Ricinus communis]